MVLKVRPVSTGVEWFPDWRGQTCVIVASGPSAKDAPLELARDRAKFIAVNNSWKLCPWADVLYGCDFLWWKAHGGVPEFSGLKVSIDARCQRLRGIRVVRRKNADKNDIEFRERGLIAWGGNGGFQALNVAVQCWPRKIVLVGFDMRLDFGAHWHGKHPDNRNPEERQVRRWREVFDNAARDLRREGVTVINASQVSALTAYPKMSFEEAIA